MIYTKKTEADRIDELLADVLEMNTNEKFSFLLDCAESLPEIDPAYKNESTLLKGCASKAWILCEIVDNHFFLSGDADAQIAKGLLGFFAELFSGYPVEILRNFDEQKLKAAGIFSSLSPSRANGALSAWKKIVECVGKWGKS